MTLLHNVTGRCTFGGLSPGSCDIMAHYRKTADAQEHPLYEAAKKRDSGVVQIGNSEFLNASSSNINLGQWVISRHNLVDGSFVRITVKKKVDAWGYRSRGLVLRMRENASHQRIRIPLIERADATMDEGTFEGRFDILYPSSWNEYDYSMNHAFMSPFVAQELADTDPEEKDEPGSEWFLIDILQEGVRLFTPKANTIETVSGQTVAVTQAARPRLLNLRRPRNK